jgi:hypothetical protein
MIKTILIVLCVLLLAFSTAIGGEVTDKKSKDRSAAYVRSHDYFCPECKRLDYEGQSNVGQVWKVWCGLPEDSGPRSKLIYKMIITPKGRLIVMPCGLYD